MELDLNALRQEIDKLDDELVKVLERRLDIVLGVAAWKAENHMPVLDRERELKVLDRAVERLHKKEYGEQVRHIMEAIMGASRELETELLADRLEKLESREEPVRVGYQGVPGSFSHEALETYFGERPVVEVNYPEFEDVVKAVKAGRVKYGVLPVENSSTGGITQVYDLIRRYDCHIVGEKCVPVVQNLLGLEDAVIGDIRKVYSHPQGFQQSRDFFRRHPEMETVPFFNTARSAKEVSERKDVTLGAVASRRAAELYGLKVLVEHINSDYANRTRFLIIADKEERRPDADKITLVVAVRHEPGSLYRMLGTLSDGGLNLLSLESRPIEGKPWEYVFHVDLTGSLEDPEVRKTLDSLTDSCSFYKVLGNYVADRGR